MDHWFSYHALIEATFDMKEFTVQQELALLLFVTATFNTKQFLALRVLAFILFTVTIFDMNQ